MLVPLSIPPGVFANGTDLQSAGRWRDASLVRWRSGALQPVGGWIDRTGSGARPDAAPRGMHAWVDNSGDRRIAIGTHAKLFSLSASGTITDITPAAFTTGISVAEPDTGYGGTFYGTGFYGIARSDNGTYSEATTWSLDNWGAFLIGCSSADGKLYEWQIDTGLDAVAISGAPTGCLGLVVTENRFLFALGAGGNKRKVQWCDREDNTTWTPTATNEAGDFDLQTNGQIMCGLRVRGQTLILTDRDAHTATESNDNFVFSFERVGTACGVVARRAAASAQAGAYWMGRNGFFRYQGGYVEEIPCDVSGLVFGSISRSQESLIHAVLNANFSEIWWFYPSNDAISCDRYVAFNYQENFWLVGALNRAAGVDRGVFPVPILIDEAGIVYNHETGFNHGGADVFVESGPVSLDLGERTFTATRLLPDEKTQGQVSVTFKSRFYPNADETSNGPYTMANPTDLLFSGRQMRMRVTGEPNLDWRWGVPRVQLQQRGKW